ncbi:MAG: hypothetical protein AB7G80_06710 [Dongiaceae bacterium]
MRSKVNTPLAAKSSLKEFLLGKNRKYQRGMIGYAMAVVVATAMAGGLMMNSMSTGIRTTNAITRSTDANSVLQAARVQLAQSASFDSLGIPVSVPAEDNHIPMRFPENDDFQERAHSEQSVVSAASFRGEQIIYVPFYNRNSNEPNGYVRGRVASTQVEALNRPVFMLILGGQDGVQTPYNDPNTFMNSDGSMRPVSVLAEQYPTDRFAAATIQDVMNIQAANATQMIRVAAQEEGMPLGGAPTSTCPAATHKLVFAVNANGQTVFACVPEQDPKVTGENIIPETVMNGVGQLFAERIFIPNEQTPANTVSKLRFRSILGGLNVNVGQSDEAVMLSVNAENAGQNGAGIFRQGFNAQGHQTMQFRRLVAGAGASVQEVGDTIVISAMGLGGGPVGLTAVSAQRFGDDNTHAIFMGGDGTPGNPLSFSDLRAGAGIAMGRGSKGELIIANTSPASSVEGINVGGGQDPSVTDDKPGANGIYAGKDDENRLMFRRLVAGQGIKISANKDDEDNGKSAIVIEVDGSVGGVANATNIGSGASVYANNANGTLSFRRVNDDGQGVTVRQVGDNVRVGVDVAQLSQTLNLSRFVQIGQEQDPIFAASRPATACEGTQRLSWDGTAFVCMAPAGQSGGGATPLSSNIVSCTNAQTRGAASSEACGNARRIQRGTLTTSPPAQVALQMNTPGSWVPIGCRDLYGSQINSFASQIWWDPTATYPSSGVAGAWITFADSGARYCVDGTLVIAQVGGSGTPGTMTIDSFEQTYFVENNAEIAPLLPGRSSAASWTDLDQTRWRTDVRNVTLRAGLWKVDVYGGVYICGSADAYQTTHLLFHQDRPVNDPNRKVVTLKSANCPEGNAAYNVSTLVRVPADGRFGVQSVPVSTGGNLQRVSNIQGIVAIRVGD